MNSGIRLACRRSLVAAASAAIVTAGVLAFGTGEVAHADTRAATTVAFAYSEQPQSWTPPPGVTQATFDLFGSVGVGARSHQAGEGGETTATIAVAAGRAYWVVTGGPGSQFGPGPNGGGGATPGGPGGGGTDVRTDATDPTSRLIVAGGGGGAGATTFFNQGTAAIEVPGGAAGDGGLSPSSGGDGSTVYDGAPVTGGTHGTAASDTAAGAGGAGGTGAVAGTAGQDGSGSSGGNGGGGGVPRDAAGGGGGGGGGCYGGGGGGGGGYTFDVAQFEGSGGGGGGGSSCVLTPTIGAPSYQTGVSGLRGYGSVTYQTPAPRPVDDSYPTPTGASLSVDAPGLLANDTVTAPATTTITPGASPTAHGGQVTVDPDGAFRYTPAAGFTGTDSFTYLVSDAGGSATATVTVTVTGTAPGFIGTPTDATAGTAYDFAFTASGVPTPAFSYTGTPPAGISLSQAGELSGTANHAGTYHFTVTATNGVAPDASRAITLTVNPGTLARLVLSPASATITAGAGQTYTTEGYDGAGNDLGPQTPTLTITPDGSCTATTCTATQPGEHTVTATASGASGTASLTVTAAACTTTITGPYHGPLRVGTGVTCINRAQLYGPVTLAAGSTVRMTDSTLHGPLTATAAAGLRICGSQLDGPISVADATGTVVIGASVSCSANTIHGPISLSGNGAGAGLGGNTIAGPVSIIATTGVSEVSGNDIRGPLACSANHPPPTDNGRLNTVSGPATGQCNALAVAPVGRR